MVTTEITPTGTPAPGRFKAGIFVGHLASAGAISLASDIGHAGFLNVSFYIPGEDWNPTVDQGKFDDVRRGATITGESLGVAKWTIPDLLYIEDVQAIGTGTPKGLLTESAVCTLICRWGLPGATDWAATTQRAYAFDGIVLGKRWVVPSASGEGGKLAYQQVVASTTTVVEDVVIAA